MKRFSKREILTEINNGNEEVLVYISRKYFSTVRRLLRLRGFRDDQTPGIFSDVLASVYTDLRIPENDLIDFESYFMNAIAQKIKYLKELKGGVVKTVENESDGVTSQCVSILDKQAQRLLFSRIAGKLSYERIKDKFEYSNAVIAQYEVFKAYDQLEGIVKLRLNISND